MGFTTIASRWMSRSVLFSRLFLSLLLLSLMLGARPVNAEKGTQAGANSNDAQVTTNLPPVAVDDSGTGFITLNHVPLRTANVLTNDSDPSGRSLFVKSFEASIAKGQVTLLDPNPDSSLDTSFGVGGVVTTSLMTRDEVHSIVIQTDGKILAAGSSQTADYVTSAIALTRYNINGSLDTSFNSTGVVTTSINSGYVYVGSAILQPDGKIVVAGTASPNMVAVRYNPNGSLDTSFSGDGIALTGFGDPNDTGHSAARQADGKILVVGESKGNFALIRLKTNGTLDTTFDKDGKLTADFGGDDSGWSVLVQTNGKIIVVGISTRPTETSGGDVAIARYNSNGSLDTSFGSGGKITTILKNPIYVYQAVLQPDGKILVVGEDTVDHPFPLLRYNPDGTLDTTFDGDGVVATNFGTLVDGNAIALQSDGKIVIAGDYYQNFGQDFLLARYDSDGSLDTSFGSDGKAVIDIPGGKDNNFSSDSDLAYAVAMQLDGKIVAAGSSSKSVMNWHFALARLNVNGTYQTRNTFLYITNGQFNALAPGEQAHDTLSYIASDGVLTDSATVTITVLGGIETYLPLTIKP